MVLLFPLRVRQNGPQTAGTGRQPRYFASRRSRNLQAGMMPPSVCCGRNERKEPPGTIAGRFLKIRPAFLPHHTGTKADALRGTTLIRRSPECRRLIALHCHPSRGSDGAHYNRIGFTSPAQRRVRRATGWLAPSTSSLNSYGRVLLLVGAIILLCPTPASPTSPPAFPSLSSAQSWHARQDLRGHSRQRLQIS